MAEVSQKVTLNVPIELSRAVRIEIANDVIDFILKRTERGLDKDNKKFKKYSDTYAASQDFAIAGKSKSHVDLQLTGDMLTALEILDTSISGFITIGYKQGEENDKAAWQRNNLQKSHPKRDFIGITTADLAKIILPYQNRSNIKRRQDQIIKEEVNKQAQAIVAGLFRFNQGSEE